MSYEHAQEQKKRKEMNWFGRVVSASSSSSSSRLTPGVRSHVHTGINQNRVVEPRDAECEALRQTCSH